MSCPDYTLNESDLLEPTCPACGEVMVPESCWQCMGAGGFHDCGEDCCNCTRPEVNVTCDECGGVGDYLVCPLAGTPGHGTSPDAA